MVKIGIIDADLISRKIHRFPNLACMKISSYYDMKWGDIVIDTQTLCKAFDEQRIVQK